MTTFKKKKYVITMVCEFVERLWVVVSRIMHTHFGIGIWISAHTLRLLYMPSVYLTNDDDLCLVNVTLLSRRVYAQLTI